MKSKLIKGIITAAIVIGIGFGGYKCYNTYFAKKTVTASVQYITMSAKKMNLQESVQGTGTAYAGITKDITPNNNGTIKDLNIKVGDTVTAGQKLFTSASDELSKNVTTAENNVSKQELTLSSDENAAKVDENKIAMDKLSLSDAKTQLCNAYSQLDKMKVTAPIGGVITAVNNSNGDNVQSGTAVLTIVDMSSIKIKVSVDELDINKIKIGQNSEIKFDAIKDKTFEGSVESIAQAGTTSNNVTNYDVIVAVKDSSGIKLGMNANVTILVNSKENALAIPAEALVEMNGQKYVRVENTDNTTTNNNNQSTATKTLGESRFSTNSGKLVAVKTGLETDSYIEVTEGVTEGQKLLVQLPSSSSTTNNKNNFGGGFGGDMGGGPGGNMGAPRTDNSNSSGNSNGTKK